MEKLLPIGGSNQSEVVRLLCEDGLTKKDSVLSYQEQEIFTLGEDLFMPFLENAEHSLQMLRWFYEKGREVRRARPAEVDDICALKEQIIRESFVFLSDQQKDVLVQKATDVDYMRKEIEENYILVCLKEDKIWAVAGLKKDGAKTGLLYSGYSNGDRAVGALLSYRIYYARKIGLRKLYGRVYIENARSARHLSRQGFRRLEGTFPGKYLPNYPLYHWVLDL